MLLHSEVHWPLLIGHTLRPPLGVRRAPRHSRPRSGMTAMTDITDVPVQRLNPVRVRGRPDLASCQRRSHRSLPFCLLSVLSCHGLSHGQSIDVLSPQVRTYLSVSTPKVVLEHVQMIDGTGAAPQPDQNIYIAGGKITAVSAGADFPQSEGTTILDLRGYSVMPGIVGMHDPLYYLAWPNLAADRSFDKPFVFL